MLTQRLMEILNRFLYLGTHYLSNVQWIFPVAHIATLSLVASNIKCFGHARTSEKEENDSNSSDDSGGELDPSLDIDNEDSEGVHHTVPFKVLGSPYSVEHQKYLEHAQTLLHERKGHVNAKIVPKNNNQHDKNAIAVMLGFGNEWKKIGYIARELTQFCIHC